MVFFNSILVILKNQHNYHHPHLRDHRYWLNKFSLVLLFGTMSTFKELYNLRFVVNKQFEQKQIPRPRTLACI